MTPGPGPTGPKPTGPGNANPGNPRPVGTPRPRAIGRTAALATQAIALIAVGLVLIAGALTAPTPPPAEPLQLRWRPATEQEERAYERQQLVDALNELRQQEGATALHTP